MTTRIAPLADPLAGRLQDAQGEPITILAFGTGWTDHVGDTLRVVVVRQSGRLEEIALDDVLVEHPGDLWRAARGADDVAARTAPDGHVCCHPDCAKRTHVG